MCNYICMCAHMCVYIYILCVIVYAYVNICVGMYKYVYERVCVGVYLYVFGW